ncbi:tyrosine--tRNA ligase [Candidatus Saccharibacteria bacterium]|nr:tyrosine--tRNA ligase [Candidatus Saccharibacteria bacterium]
MKLSEELAWRGFVNQTTYKDATALDGDPITFYWGVDPSASSMQIGNFAAAMMVKHLVKAGHRAVLLVGGATGMIGDPDGKNDERSLKTLDEIAHNKTGISAQYTKIFEGYDFDIVDNYDWFKTINYVDFLRDIGKHVPMSQMLGREFVQSRLGESGSGISYAEFSYSLIQAYDFLHLNETYGVTLQVCGADQWGNSIAGVDLVRRTSGREVNVWSTPLVINKATGIKFGKSESGAIWLDPNKTSPAQFYQFWINCDDEGIEEYMKIYTELSQPEITEILAEHSENRQQRYAQRRLAQEVTALVHGEIDMRFAETVTEYLTGRQTIADAGETALAVLRQEIPSITLMERESSVIEALVATGLASSNSDARRLLTSNAVSVNGVKITNETFAASDFRADRLLLRRGKAFKDSALVEYSGN